MANVQPHIDSPSLVFQQPVRGYQTGRKEKCPIAGLAQLEQNAQHPYKGSVSAACSRSLEKRNECRFVKDSMQLSDETLRVSSLGGFTTLTAHL